MVRAKTFREQSLHRNNERSELRGLGFVAARANAGFQTGNNEEGADLEELLKTMHLAASDNEELARQLKAYDVLALMQHYAPEQYKSIAPLGEVLADIDRARSEPGYRPVKAINFASTLSYAAANAIGSLAMARSNE